MVKSGKRPQKEGIASRVYRFFAAECIVLIQRKKRAASAAERNLRTAVRWSEGLASLHPRLLVVLCGYVTAQPMNWKHGGATSDILKSATQKKIAANTEQGLFSAMIK
jgi:hypothetical protein